VKVLGVAAEVGDASQLGQVQQQCACGRIDHRATAHAQALRVTLQDGCSGGQDVVAQHLPGLQHGFTANARAPAGPGAAAIGRGVGVARDDADTGDVHAHGVGRNLGEYGFGALALFAHAAHHRDGAAGFQPQRGAVLAGDPCATHAIESRTRVRQFDQGRHADAAVDAAFAQGRLFGTQRVVVAQPPSFTQADFMRQHFQLDA
jgi:hypothetical protein